LSDDPDNIRKVATFVAPMTNVEWVEVLPFHQMGEFKWKSLGQPDGGELTAGQRLRLGNRPTWQKWWTAGVGTGNQVFQATNAAWVARLKSSATNRSQSAA
jgi:hypothetical protein